MKTLFSISALVAVMLALLPLAVHSQVVAEDTYDYTDLTTNSQVVNVPKYIQTLQRKTIEKRELRLTLDHGENYPLGGLDWDVSMQLEVNAVDGSGTQVQLFQPSFYIHDNPAGTGEPEQTIVIDYTVAWSAIEKFQINVMPGNLQVNGASADEIQLAIDHLRLKVVAEDFVGYHIKDFNNAPVTVDASSMSVTGKGTSISDSRVVRAHFDWDLSDPTQYYHEYDLQVLKVEPDGFSADLPLNNWQEAMNVAIDHGQTHYTMTIAEGTGYYAWRVRPIGNYYPGGRSNRKNIGDWNAPSGTISSGAISGHHYTFTDKYTMHAGLGPVGLQDGVAISNDAFFYQQFDEDINWMYGRTLTEDNRASESMTYANAVNEARQSQAKIFSQSTVIGSASVYDYNGRPSLQILPAPTEKPYLAFDPNFATSNNTQYNAEHFDATGNVFSPDQLDPGSAPEKYYSDGNIGQLNDRYVPTADHKPFSRTIYNSEGRDYVQSGVGKVLGIGADGDVNTHNAKILYGSPAQVELDRLFGTEAPRANTVVKTVNHDANGVSSIAYIGKSGTQLATCINGEVTPTNMLPIDNLNAQTFTVTQTLDPGTVTPGGWTSLTTTKIIVEAPNDNNNSTIDTKPYGVDYSITPLAYGNACADVCYTCDYVVEISVSSLEYPMDPNRNVLLRITIDPTDLSPNGCLHVATSTDLSTLIANYGHEVEDGQGNTSTNAYMGTIIGGVVNLQTGSYLVQKKVITNNPDPNSNNTHLQNRLMELLASSWNWTGQSNCCGPVNIDISGFNCDISAELECGNAFLDDEVQRWFDDIVTREQTATLGNGDLYKDHLTVNPLTSDSYANFGDFKQLIDDLCAADYDPVDVFSCMQVYGAMLEMNITAADQITAGNGGNGANPPMTFNPLFDLLGEVFDCIGYNPDPNYYDCSYFELTADWGSTEQAQADLNGVYYICTWHTGLTSGNHPTSIGGQPDVNNGGKILYVEVLDPNNQVVNTTLAQNSLCVDAHASPSAFTVGMSPTAAEAFLAQRLCECLTGTNATIPGNGAPLLAAATPIEACMDACESKATAYELAVTNFVTDYNSEDGILTDEVDPNTGYSIWVDPNAPGFNAAVDRWYTYNDLVPTATVLCNTQVMEAQCINDCQMMVTTQVMDDLANNGCACNNSPCYVAPNGLGTFDCVQAFIDDPIFAQVATDEQLRFQAALTHIPEYAPVAPNAQINTNPPHMYSNVGSQEAVQDAIIQFIERSLQFNMRFRSNQYRLGQGTANPQQSWFAYNNPQPFYIRETETFNYRIGPGVIRPIDVVTTVVWRPANESLSGDDHIKELNVAAYCQGSTTPLFQWAYSPQINNQCPLLNATSPLGMDLKSGIVNFWFDDQGQFHAQLVPGTCDFDQPSSLVSTETCTSPALASAVFEITGGSSPQLFFPEVVSNNLGNIYITNNAIPYATSTDATAAAVALAINNTVTQPNFTASIDPGNLSRVIVYTGSDLQGLDPLNFSFVFGGLVPASVIQPFQLCGSPFNTLVSGCTGLVNESLTEDCPYGFEKTSVQTALQGVGYQLNGLNDDFGDDLERFFNEALTTIIVNRASTSTPVYPIAGFTVGVDDNVYYEKVRTFIGQTANVYKAYVSVLGKETVVQGGVRKELLAIQLGLHCHNAAGSPLLAFTITNGVLNPLAPTTVYPELSFDPNGSSFNPLGFPGAIPYIFTDMSQIDHYNSTMNPNPCPTCQNGSYDHLQLDLNLGTIAAGGWTNSALITGNGVRTELPVGGWAYLGNQQQDFFTGSAVCAPMEPCFACFRWQEPNTRMDAVPVIMPTCEDETALTIATQTQQTLGWCLNEQQDMLIANYRDNCLNNITDELSLDYELMYGYYTLFYYDRAGTLIKTVPPKGVTPITGTQLTDVVDFRKGTSTTEVLPVYPYTTHYQGNSIGQTESVITPDGDETHFWYRADGLQILSQDAGQAALNRYSYTKYDELGRTIETGELLNFTPTFADPAQTIVDELWLNADFPTNVPGVSYTEQIWTTYTSPDASITYKGQGQKNLRNRISQIKRKTANAYATSMWYSYDPHGNPDWTVEFIPEIGFKTMRYEYDLISGNILKTYYMEDTQEQLITASEYDSDNRIIRCLTSVDGITWERDSEYEFYQTGGMSRKEIGEDRVQGMDYVQTIDGMFKSLNQVKLDPSGALDPGLDGMWSGSFTVEPSANGTNISGITVDGVTAVLATTVPWNLEGAAATASDLVAAINVANNQTPATYPFRATNKGGRSATVELRGPAPSGQGNIVLTGSMTTGDLVAISAENSVAPDEYAIELGYYHEDYLRSNTHIGAGLNNGQATSYNPYASNLGTTNQITAETHSLYNGNISYAMSKTRSGTTSGANPMTDLTVRVFRHDMLNRLKESDHREFTGVMYNSASNQEYDEYFKYDLNGNIDEVQRFGWAGGNSSNPSTQMMDDLKYYYDPANNQLEVIEDAEGVAYSSHDLSDQSILGGNNYTYDDAGRMVHDATHGLSITWNTFLNKPSRVEKRNPANNNLIHTIDFEYSPGGSRILKQVTDASGIITSAMYYPMGGTSIYKKTYGGGQTSLMLIEQTIGMAERVGLLMRNKQLFTGSGYIPVLPSIEPEPLDNTTEIPYNEENGDDGSGGSGDTEGANGGGGDGDGAGDGSGEGEAAGSGEGAGTGEGTGEGTEEAGAGSTESPAETGGGKGKGGK